jgi:hypothetical protein
LTGRTKWSTCFVNNFKRHFNLLEADAITHTQSRKAKYGLQDPSSYREEEEDKVDDWSYLVGSSIVQVIGCSKEIDFLKVTGRTKLVEWPF